MHTPYIAFNRFAYGATPALANTTINDAQQWLRMQLKPYIIENPKWSSEEALRQIFDYRRDKKAADQVAEKSQLSKAAINDSEATLKTARQTMLNGSKALTEQIVLQAINTTQPLQARLLDFFANHFSVSNTNTNMRAIAPTLEVEAIAANLHGYFADMLIAVSRHPAMLYYLNNENSIGPNSRLGLKRKKRGLNENLGREILELHTLGVNGGYSQKDVLALSKALSGWTIGGKKETEPLGFMFKAFAHEPGEKILLGKRYASANNNPRVNDNAQALQMLTDLAVHKQTAQHLSYKLAKHFISDEPPPALVEAMTKRWLSSKGHIPSVITVMIEHNDSWSPNSNKFKTPREFLISLCRACQLSSTKPNILKTLDILGQAPYSSGSPAGFSDNAKDWASATAIMNRIEWSEHIAGQVKTAPIELAKIALGNLLSPSTAQHILRAESKRQSLAMLFMSPEFLRR